MMSGSNIPCALTQACIVTCFLQSLSATLVNECSASSASHTNTILEFESQQCTVESKEVEAFDMVVNFLQSRTNLQQKLNSQEQHELTSTKRNTVEAESVEHKHKSKAFDCEAHPKLCEAPFNCHETSFNSTFNYIESMTQPDSEIPKFQPTNGPNLQDWCLAPQHEDYIHECLVERDLVNAGKIRYGQMKAGDHGPGTFELMGMLCFMEGHCSNRRVTSNTTLVEASQMCDERFGRTRWTSVGSSPQEAMEAVLPALANVSNPQDAIDMMNYTAEHGFSSREETTELVVQSCAAGHYHCEIMMCKETYCKDEYFINEYGHFQQELGWKTSTASWMNAQE